MNVQQTQGAQTEQEIALVPTPKIGDYWPGQGGFYAGIIRDGDRQWHLILAEQPATDSEAWDDEYEKIPGEFSQRDGAHNTALILAADPNNKIATAATALTVDGHSDFYFAAEAENQLIRINLPDRVKPIWHWSSTQDDAGYAWNQDFSGGLQYIYRKDGKLAARAVRRILIIE